jgi:predicted RNA binding protein YcfA (HicA-like mRNA interferase family)
MSKLPEITYRELIRKIKLLGFIFDRQAKGSHEIWYNPTNHLRTTIPNHNKPFSKGTLRAIIRQINVSVEEFSKL